MTDYQVMPPPSDGEYDALKADIAERGWERALRTAVGDNRNICQHDWGGCTHFPNGVRDKWTLVLCGRAHSGRRWFWTAEEYDHGRDEWLGAHGRVDTELDAVKAMAIQLNTLTGDAVRLALGAKYATYRMRGLNAEARAARIAAKAASADTDTAPIEYVYGLLHHVSDDSFEPDHWSTPAFRVTRKTAKRVYYDRGDDYGEGFIDRAVFERDGKATNRGRHWSYADRTLYVEPQPRPEHRYLPPDLPGLKKAMADAHPDRGGNREEFEKARTQYLRAKRMAS